MISLRWATNSGRAATRRAGPGHHRCVRSPRNPATDRLFEFWQRAVAKVGYPTFNLGHRATPDGLGP